MRPTRDAAYRDQRLAELYDAYNPWGPGDDLFLRLVMGAQAVLDVGCGTGALLRAARRNGHGGRLLGVDPAAAMLTVARRGAGSEDIEWIEGRAADVADRGPFDLVVMTGRAFQFLTTDAEITTSLDAVRTALRVGGRLVVEVSNPAAQVWQQWTPVNAITFPTPQGDVRLEHDAELLENGREVRFTETFSSPSWPAPLMSESVVRFHTDAEMRRWMTGAGLVVTSQLGDWTGATFQPRHDNIITIAERPAA